MTPRTILVTGSTDGIGALTARLLAARGHTVLLHGRNPHKLATVAEQIGGDVERYVADLSRLDAVDALAAQLIERLDRLDVLINNAGVFKTAHPRAPSGLDVRFVVNTLAPYALTRRLLPIIPESGRVVNLSSAAQAPVDLDALAGRAPLDDMAAYAQSKLALTIWSRALAAELPAGPAVIPVNPGSLLASKMVREGFGVAGKDLRIGAELLCRVALDGDFAWASGRYFDNDAGEFADPHPAALDPARAAAVTRAIAALVDPTTSTPPES